MKPIQVRLVGRFRLTGKISGSHQHILYQAVHTQTDSALFLKGQQLKNKPVQNFLSILQQGKILQTMQGGIGIPHMYWCGQQQDYNFIVLQQLQSDFTQLLSKCSGKFTLKSVYMFAQQAISILQYYHFKNFIHNHINPKHFMIGAGDKYGKLFLVDYSNSIRYRDAQTLQHIAQNPDRKIQIRCINMQFSSINYHKGSTASRKDDLISLLYVLLYFLRGELPWSSIMHSKRSQIQKCRLILKQKTTMPAQQVFGQYIDLLTLYNYTQSLTFDQKPRYTYYTNIFKQRLEKNGFIDDKIYDWYLIQDQQSDDQIDFHFQVIPNQEQFIKQLTQEIQVREKVDQPTDKTNNQIKPKRKNNKNQKDCTIY